MGSTKRPADLLVTGAGAGLLALDVTIWTRLLGVADVLDAVVNRKLERGKADCDAAGWRLRVWAADTFGAVHPATRPLVGKLISLLRAQTPWKDPDLVSQEVWSALSAAILARAASQHCRLATTAALQPGTAFDVLDDDSDEEGADDAEPVHGAAAAVYMDADGKPPGEEVLGTFNPQPDLPANEVNPDAMDADACRENADVSVNSALVMSGPAIDANLQVRDGCSEAVDHLNELALMEVDAGCTGGDDAAASEAFRITARLAAPFACEPELGPRRLLYCDDDPETGCRIYTRDPVPAGDEDALYE